MPPSLNNLMLIKAMEHHEQLLYDIPGDCPTRCQCFNQPSSNSVVVQCNNHNLSDMALTVPALPKKFYGYSVHFSGNNIVSFIIRLDNNRIQSIDADTLAAMANVYEAPLRKQRADVTAQ
jgi:hypothetical protein